jgi:hypothetical protein
LARQIDEYEKAVVRRRAVGLSSNAQAVRQIVVTISLAALLVWVMQWALERVSR